MRKCRRCENTLVLPAFGGAFKTCIQCRKVKKAWADKNREQERALSLRWYHNNKEKAAKNKKHWKQANQDKVRAQDRRRRANKRSMVKESYTAANEARTRFFFDERCVRCGSTGKLQIDHHRPLSKGYALDLGNAAVLCSTCNNHKQNKMPADFYTTKELRNVNLRIAAAYWGEVIFGLKDEQG